MLFQRISVVLLAILAIGISRFLIPSKEELALVYLKDKKFKHSYEIYKEEINNGNKRPFILLPMVKLHLHYGDVQKAISLMEDFTKDHPKSLEGLQMLAKYYQYGQKYDKYLETIERIVDLNPSPKNLKNLSKIYNYNAHYKKQIDLLQTLIRKKQAKPNDYLNLSHLEAGEGYFQKAFQTLKQLQKDFPKNFLLEHLRLSLHLFLKTKTLKEKEVFKMAKNYHAQHNSPKETLRLSQALLSIGKTKIVENILKSYPEKRFASEELYSDFIQMRLLQGKEEEEKVYKSLLERYQKGAVSSKIAEIFLPLILKKKNIPLLLDVLKRADLIFLSEEALISLAETSLLEKLPSLALYILDYFKNKKVPLSPLPKALLIISSKKSSSYRELYSLIENDSFLQEEKEKILRLSLYTKDETLIYHLSYAFFKESSLTISELENLADFFISLGRAEEGYLLFKKKYPSPDEKNIAWALLATAAKKSHEVLQWIKRYSLLEEEKILKLFFLSQTFKEFPLAASLAEKLYTLRPQKKYRILLAESYVKIGKIKEALPLYRSLAYISHNTSEEYIKKDYRYLLIEAVKKKIATAEELETLLHLQWKEDKLSIKEKREFAYLFNEIIQDYSSAKKLFFELASLKNPSKNDIESLLYLSDLPQDQKITNWIIKKIQEEKGQKKYIWIKRLIDKNCPEIALSCIEKTLKTLQAPYPKKLLFLYVLGARRMTSPKRLKKALTLAASQEKNLLLLKHYLSIAFEHQFNFLTKNILKSVYSLDRENSYAFLIDSILSYRKGEKERMISLFKKWENSPSKYEKEKKLSFTIHFLYAECLHEKGEEELSQIHFQKAYELFSSLPPPLSLETKAYALQNLYRLGKKKEAIALLKGPYPSDKTDFLKAIYFQTFQHKLYALSKEAALALFQILPSKESRVLLSLALSKTKEIEKALFFIRPAKEENEELYFDLLCKNARKHPIFQNELLDWISFKLENTKDLPDEKKRNFAYILLQYSKDLRYPLSIFYNLAQKAAFTSKDIKQTLYLWKSHPKEKNLPWIKKRFLQSKSKKERLFWLQELEQLSSPQELLSLLGPFKNRWSQKIQDLYLKNLLIIGDENSLSKILQSLKKEENHVKRLEKLALFAKDAQLKHIAENFFAKILLIDKNHPLAHRELGLVEYAKKDYSDAKKFLSFYVRNFSKKNLEESDFIAFYRFGEILLREHKNEKAKRIFIKLCQILDSYGKKGLYLEILQAEILSKLSRTEEALSLMRRLLILHPNKDSVKITLADFLIDMGNYREAERLLYEKKEKLK